MKKKNLTNSFQVLENEKSSHCISIIIPTHRLSPDRRTDPEHVEKTIQQAKQQLQSKYAPETTKPLLQAIDELYEQIDFMHNGEGIGLFVSENAKSLIHFVFPVKETIMIDQTFHIRDLIYECYYDIPYKVLMLSEKEARLFNARLNNLTEITDANFPKRNDAKYEYSRPSRGSSYVGHAFLKEFEKDKSVTEEIRLKSFFRETDELLKSYFNIETSLIITGDNKDLSYFSQITEHIRHIACNIPGNYTRFNQHEFGNLTWKAMKQFLDTRKEKMIRDYKEKSGEGLGVTGIENIWKAVMEGRGFKLLVEKDYSVPGYLNNNNDFDLQLHPPKKPHRTFPDVVNKLIQLVLEKNGEVIMTENDMLKDFKRMALITRY